MDSTQQLTQFRSPGGTLQNINLQAFKGEEFRDFEAAGFQWRWKYADEQFVRVITLEQDSTLDLHSGIQATLVPANFHFRQQISQLDKMRFSTIEMQMKNGNVFNVLTVKQNTNKDVENLIDVPSLQPSQLKWIPETEENCTKYQFGLMCIDGIDVVTLETDFYYNQNGVPPVKFYGLPENVSGGFCWRWLNHEEQDYRVVTVEGPPLTEESQQMIVIVDNLNVQGIDEYSLQFKYTFGLRSTLMENGFVFKAVTLENGGNYLMQQKKFNPVDLRWTSETEEDCSNYQFGMLEMENNGSSYQLLLLK